MIAYEIGAVEAGYRGTNVIEGISVRIHADDFLGVIGPNGAGKSTLLKLLTGNLRPSAGTIAFRGRALAAYTERELARELAVVHQHIENVLPFTVEEFVTMGRFPHRRPWEIAREDDHAAVAAAIESVGIAGLARRPLTELSGGELQLARIALALAQDCGVILLDEPTSFLDIAHAVRIMDALHGMHRRGKTIITVLHDINTAADYCTRIVGIGGGRIAFDGPPAAVLTYENLEALYGTTCIVYDNAVTKKPHVFTVPEYARRG
ncbi:MAG TPA: ABC transporter ATP-binding protein [Spirochaetota bacterium]|nr:ABC transporter ATP-binding protein [Spirochaetota bacterium]